MPGYFAATYTSISSSECRPVSFSMRNTRNSYVPAITTSMPILYLLHCVDVVVVTWTACLKYELFVLVFPFMLAFVSGSRDSFRPESERFALPCLGVSLRETVYSVRLPILYRSASLPSGTVSNALSSSPHIILSCSALRQSWGTFVL